MTTELQSHTVLAELTRFYGGERLGQCIQVTIDRGREIQYITLTKTQAESLALDLLLFAQGQEQELDREDS